MTVPDLVEQLEREGVRLWVESGQLRFRAPEGVMTDDRRAALRSGLPGVMEYLRQRDRQGELEPDLAARLEPFPLTDVQQAYLLGRSNAFAFGGVACHGYGEITLPGAEPEQVAAAWRQLVARHDMLRAVISPDGSQRILAEVPDYQVAVRDLRGAAEGEVAGALEQIRAEMGHRQHPIGGWPMFEVRLTRTAAGLMLHLSIDFLICDLLSTQLLFTELAEIVRGGRPARPAPAISFRDYVLAESAARSGPAYERDREYWAGRIGDIPPAPELPTRARPDGSQPAARFRRHRVVLGRESWAALRRNAGARGVTASVAVLAAYAEVIARWSRHPGFTLNLTLQNRQPLHPDVGSLVGDFTSVGLLPVTHDAAQTLTTRARTLQATLWETLDHRLYSGLAVARDISRARGSGEGLFPVVFTSGIGVADRDDGGQFRLADMGYGITQTPQVTIDCQALEGDGALAVNWDVRDGVFPAGVIEDAFAAFAGLLARMADDESCWDARCPVELPASQRERRAAVNSTSGPLPDGLLHEDLVARALREPDRQAVVAGGRTLRYGELLGRALAVARRLEEAGLRPGDIAAVCMDKGWEQIAGVLGILLAGGVYLPVDTGQPAARRGQILADAGVRHLLVRSATAAGPEPGSDMVTVPVSELGQAGLAGRPPLAGSDDLAYVIYTSGSTGVPKGVMITHRAALNTVTDITRRFGVSSADTMLGLASLGFDLSVYDIFGVLGAGGRLVLPDHARRADPSHWADLVARHAVTLWNSVPAQLHMLGDYLRTGGRQPSELSSLRLALLSGDWIPVTLPERMWDLLPGLELVSLGGATEAAIWSVMHRIDEVDPGWASIPYGRPLTNQTLDVLDDTLEPRPDLVVGELYIGGAGLAAGYLGDPEKTADRFIRHPRTGARLYRTGDLARYLPTGEVELMGRVDRQVKIRGTRIELAEVEHALGSHPDVGAAAVVAVGDGPLDRKLVGFAEPARHGGAQRGMPAGVTEAAAAGAGAVTGAVDLVRYRAYRQALDEVSLLAMRDALSGLGLFGPGGADQVLRQVAGRHHRLVRRWLRALTDNNLVSRDGAGRYRLAGEPAATSWEDVAALSAGIDPPELTAYFRASLGRLPQLVRAEQDPLPLLFPPDQPGVASAVFGGPLETRAANRAIAAAVRWIGDDAGRPLRVLEVGAGTGSTTCEVLTALSGRPADYLFTDVSPYFTSGARERFGPQPGMRYATYDLDLPPLPQGLPGSSFDVVIAGDALHASADVAAALRSLVELLVPGGWLVAAEPVTDSYPVMASLELLVRLAGESGDFADLRRGRDQTFLSQQDWQSELTRAAADAVAWPGADDPVLSASGMRVFVARVKTDRARLDAAGLTSYLAGRLPAPMVPSELLIVDALPVTKNAKVDHKTLASWVPRAASAAGRERAADPESDLERRIAALWAEAFGMPQVGRDQSFLGLGGDSLVAARLAGRLREEIPEASGVYFDDLLRQILEGTTVAGLAESMQQAVTAGPAGDDGAAGSGPLRILGGAGTTGYVIMHDAAADIEPYRKLAGRLASAGVVASLAAEDAGAEPAASPERIASLLAEQCATGLAAAGIERACLVGLGEAGKATVEAAAWLAGSGIDVAALVVISGAAPRRAGQGFAQYRPAPFAGDLTLICLDEPASDAAARPWREMCLGEVRVRSAAVGDQDALAAAVLDAATPPGTAP